MKCELCDADATFHTTTVDADGNSLSRSLCQDHGRQVATEAGLQLPSCEKPLAGIVEGTKRLADFLRANRRMPTSHEMMALGESIGPPRNDTDEDIDVYIGYLEAFTDFFDRNGRFPTEDELHDPF